MPTMTKNQDLKNLEISLETPERKIKTLEEGGTYKGLDIDIKADGENYWGSTVIGDSNLITKVNDTGSTYELKIKIDDEVFANLTQLQEKIVDCVRKNGEGFDVEIDEEDCIGKKFVRGEDDSGFLMVKLKNHTKYFNTDKTPIVPVDGESYVGAYGEDYGSPGVMAVSNPNTKVSIFFQPNGAYVINGVCHFSCVASQIRILSSGECFKPIPYSDRVIDIEAEDSELKYYSITNLAGDFDESKLSFGRVEAMGGQKKQNITYPIRGVNKFPTFQTGYCRSYGIEAKSADDDGKKVIKLYAPSNSDGHEPIRKNLEKFFKRVNDHLCEGDVYKTATGKKPKKNTTKGGTVKGAKGKTQRLCDGLSGSMNTFAWQEKTLRDGEESFWDKMKLKIPTDKEGVVTVPIFDEHGEKVDASRMMDSEFTRVIDTRAIFQVNGIWMSSIGYGVMTSVKQLHVRTRGNASSSGATASSYLTFEEDEAYGLGEISNEEVVEICC